MDISEHRELEREDIIRKRKERTATMIPQNIWELLPENQQRVFTKATTQPPEESSVLKAVKSDLEAREAKGIQTYGTTLDTAVLTRRERLNHLYEELLDSAMYIKLEMMKDE